MYYIQSISNNNNNNISMRSRKPIGDRNNSSSFLKRLKQKLLNIVNERTFEDTKERDKALQRATDFVSKPHWNRTIMGVTAVSQPIIDYYNPWVDEDTREVSKNKTIAKICVGSAVGIIVRKIIYDLITNMTDTKSPKKWKQFLLPKNFTKEGEIAIKHLANYKSTLSSFISIGVMLFTNFKIDAPLTAYFTNKLNEKRAKKTEALIKKEQSSNFKGVSTYV